MRPRALVASVALTALLAGVALPKIAGSATPTPVRPVEAAAFQEVDATTIDEGAGAPRLLDVAYRSANSLLSDGTLTEPGNASEPPAGRSAGAGPAAAVRSVPKPPRYSLTGFASWYSNGTTAMRLPYGTIVRICGDGGCVLRVVTDWGPSDSFRPIRIADMTPADFATVCGCGTWRGTTYVRVDVY